MALFVKTVAAPYLMKEMASRLVIGKMAVDISKEVPDLAWSGSEIVFPVYSRVAEGQEIDAKGSITPTEIDGSSTTAPIRHVGAAVKYHQDTIRTSGGKVLADMAIRDLADAMALKLDGDIMSAAIKGAKLKAAAASGDTLSQDELESAFSLFGDKQSVSEFAGIVIHSKLFPSVLAMQGFTATNLTYTQQGNGVVMGQQVGFYRGVGVYLSNNGNYDSECKTLIVKKNALAYALKKSVEFNEQYNPTTFYTDVVADTYAAAKLMDEDGVALIAKTIV